MTAPRPITQADIEQHGGVVVRFTGPGEVEAGIEPCHALVSEVEHVVRVPWQLDEIDLVHLAKGGTLWLCVWGGLPVHAIEVEPPR